ncbi:hypothetical protein [Halobacillus litoralis]|uniref:hypothetical protein n=1 Tax=Halobacillus litoralis TaxID=45668 RepID=UPI001CFD5F2B|nr:hypothetical protein [Halobacillus litoralis]
MGSELSLMEDTFSMIEETNQNLETTTMLPKIGGDGWAFRERNGDMIADYTPGVHEGFGTFSDGHGNAIADIRPDVNGNHTFDFGGGETVSATDNVMGGETFHQSGDVIGYSNPAPVEGGINFFGNAPASSFNAAPGPFGGVEISKGMQFEQLNQVGDMSDALGAASLAADAEEAAGIMGGFF